MDGLFLRSCARIRQNALGLKPQLSQLGPKKLSRTVAHLLMMLKTPGSYDAVPWLGISITWFSSYDGGPAWGNSILQCLWAGLYAQADQLQQTACMLGLTNSNKRPVCSG